MAPLCGIPEIVKTNPESASSSRVGQWLAGIVFVAALSTNFFSVTHNLDTGHLAGHEFRQSQTALSILFIQREQNYALAYPTPVFGPPWSIPMEFPLFQWASAVVSTETGASIPKTSRLISIVCFYLALIAIGLLLRRFSADGTTILLALALVLLAPIYIFYSRAVLIESLALALGLWFLWAFDVVRQSGAWWAVALTAFLGALAATVKVTTFAVWGGIALGLGIAKILDLYRRGSPQERNTFIAQASIAGIIPLVAGISWVRFADAVKLTSPGGFFLTSENLSDFNIGKLADRFDPALWKQLFSHAQVGIFPLAGWILLILVVSVSLCKKGRPLVGWLTLTMVGTWLAFPHLYQIHDYYFYAIGVLPLVAIVVGFQDLFRRTRWSWAPAVLVASLGILQWRSYAENYLPPQQVVSNGGNELLDFLNDATHPDDVLLVAGADWSANVPYFTGRRTMAFKQNLHEDPEIIARMINSLPADAVAGLILLESGAGAQKIVEAARERFNLAERPTLRAENQLYYARKDLRAEINFALKASTSYGGLILLDDVISMEKQTDEIVADSEIHPATSNLQRSIFNLIQPSPNRYRVEFGLFLANFDNKRVLGAHADTDLWIPWDQATATFEVEHGLIPYQNEDEANHSDGVWFHVWGVTSAGEETLIWERWIDPWNNDDERGVLLASFRAQTAAYTEFRFATRAGPNKAYDSAFWGRIEIK
ncbi:MAG: hypothetical protein SynsKO_02230 [Synoicihabitans sp.]